MALQRRAAPYGSIEPEADGERVLAALSYCALRAGSAVLLVAPDAGARAELLDALARRIRPQRRPVLTQARPRDDGRLVARILATAGSSVTRGDRRDPWRSVERASSDGRPIVILIDEADALSARALRELLDLAGHPSSRTTVVFAVEREDSLLEGVRAHGATLDLVRFAGKREAARQPARLRTADQVDRRRERGVEPPPEPATSHRLLIAIPITVALLLAVGAFEVVSTVRVASRWLSEDAAPTAGQPRRVTTPRLPSQAPSSAPTNEPTARSIETSVEPAGITDLRDALEILASDAAAAEHEAATLFLRERGPDPEGYELLTELDARVAGSPSEAVTLLNARSRVRRALCAAWSDDPLGEAPVRLGCPGAGAGAP